MPEESDVHPIMRSESISMTEDGALNVVTVVRSNDGRRHAFSKIFEQGSSDHAQFLDRFPLLTQGLWILVDSIWMDRNWHVLPYQITKTVNTEML
ncbi:MAG TPA: hypothetical protein V6C72_13940 [Chroococcales cyanobacterium]